MKESSSTSHSSTSPCASASASFSCTSSPPHNFDGSLVPPPPLSAPSSTSDALLVKNDHQTLQGTFFIASVERSVNRENVFGSFLFICLDASKRLNNYLQICRGGGKDGGRREDRGGDPRSH